MNVTLERTAENVRKVCELARCPDVPVFAGSAKPMQRPLRTAEHVHGKTGPYGADLPDPVMPLQPQHAVDVIIKTLRREPPGSVILCCLGPMTNVATVLVRAPDIVPRIQRVVAMEDGMAGVLRAVRRGDVRHRRRTAA